LNPHPSLAVVQDAKKTIVKKIKEKYPDLVKGYRPEKKLNDSQINNFNWE
jgi:hypothetical protein